MPALKRIGAAALSAFGFGQGGGATTVTANYLIVAGGGGATSGGGGAGGYQANTTTLTTTTSYTVTVGAGGTGGTGDSGGNGSPSSISGTGFTTLTSVGGGGGGGAGASGVARAGGSGGGGGALAAGTSVGGSGTAGQGNAGGGNGGYTASPYPSGGGGGAGAAGSNASSSTASGNGGNGSASSISGSSVTYAGGGGGGVYTSPGTAGSGGSGGGGAGNGTSGSANLGGGGGGGTSVGNNGGNGGSGIVIISYTGAQQFGGGVVTSAAGNTIHTFYTSGVLSPLSSLSASYLIVAGGGGGGWAWGGGGGGGGFLSGSALTIDTNSTYAVVVGAGGAGGTSTANSSTIGGNSTFSMVSTVAVGGGRGSGPSDPSPFTGGAGGSGGGAVGGGASGSAASGGAGTAGQGNNGGSTGANPSGGAGGGGAGAAGGSTTQGTPSNAGNGGTGNASSITGTSTYYAGGGGGGTTNASGAVAGTGGNGGGGNGSTGVGTAGTANTGGGGGGGGYNGTNNNGAAGGSGIVVIAYAGSTQQMSGGSVTISGGNVIHTFTSSGYLTPLTNFSYSLRFRASASPYLNRTPTVTSNRRTYTFSGWFKKGNISATVGLYEAWLANRECAWNWGSNGQVVFQIYFDSYNLVWASAALYRDPAAWYHFVLSVDTTQASAANAVKLYVNGVQDTSVTYTAYSGSYAQNLDTYVNTAGLLQKISTYDGIQQFYDGQMAAYYFIDGQALTPNSFGSFNQYGNWAPITYGGSFGTNGFFLPFNAGAGVSTYSGGFNGTSQYLNVNYSPNWSTLGNFTMEAWIYPTAFSSSINAIGGTSHAQNDFYSVMYFYSDGKLAWGINGTNEFTSATGAVVLNRWQHVAAVRTGSNLVLYVNGQSVATTSSASTYLSNNSATMYIGATSTVNQYFVGNMSNFRFTTAAIYTGNFIPPVAPLTADSNTQVLTLQSSTIIDNSGNSRTITNNGTVTTAAATPFANPYTLCADQSPQGNNWTPVNISTTAGATYDSLYDVPTLSNATSSNYCVLNPLYVALPNASIVNANLGLTCSVSSDNRIAGTIFITSGKWYYETGITAVGSGTVYFYVGWVKYNRSQTTNYANLYWNSYEWGSDGQRVTNTNGSSSTVAGATFANGDILGIAFDADAGTITCYKNGTSLGVYFSGITVDAPMTPNIYVNNNSCFVNFGQRPFTYTPPSGYLALNTYNM